jgi:hypothetical protein
MDDAGVRSCLEESRDAGVHHPHCCGMMTVSFDRRTATLGEDERRGASVDPRLSYKHRLIHYCR